MQKRENLGPGDLLSQGNTTWGGDGGSGIDSEVSWRKRRREVTCKEQGECLHTSGKFGVEGEG